VPIFLIESGNKHRSYQRSNSIIPFDEVHTKVGQILFGGAPALSSCLRHIQQPLISIQWRMFGLKNFMSVESIVIVFLLTIKVLNNALKINRIDRIQL